jgi:hypothetical protein
VPRLTRGMKTPFEISTVVGSSWDAAARASINANRTDSML